MNLELRELSAAAYAEQVLPHTLALWGAGRPADAYAAQTSDLANSRYGRKNYRTLALSNGNSDVLCSFKRYEREAILRGDTLRGMGIGAVFTPEENRGRGYASAMLGLALDQGRRDGFDFAYLFSDIRPQFYADIGFTELPSRSISLRADSLSGERIRTAPLDEPDWSGVRRCFDAGVSRRDWGLVRTPIVWDWLRSRMRGSDEYADGQPVNLVARTGRSIRAYVIGRREPKHDSYILEEFGFADGCDDLVAPLLRSAAGDLRRIAGWLPPEGARTLLPRGSVRKRTGAIWMIAPLSARGRRFAERASASGGADGVWSLDHV